MKKILSLILVCIMIFSLAACDKPDNVEEDNPLFTPQPSQNDSTNTNPSINETQPSTPSQETDKNEDDEDSIWKTKDVSLPTFNNIDTVKLPVAEGHEVQNTLVVSPWQLKDYDINATADTIKKSPLFNGWTFGLEERESVDIKTYSEIGQTNGYEWEKSIVGSADYNDYLSYASDVNVTYSSNTTYVIGYERIEVEIKLKPEDWHKDVQDQIYEVLKAVYGEEYATFLCYAPYINGNLLFEEKQSNALIEFRRNVRYSDSKYDPGYTYQFWINMDHRISYQPVKAFSGNGEYTSILKDKPEYLYDLLGNNIGSFDVREYDKLCHEFFEKHYPGYVCTTPNTSTGYILRTLTLDNGHHVVSFDMEADISAKDNAPANFIIDYEIIHNGSKFTDVELKFQCGTGSQGDNINDTEVEKLRDKYFKIGAKMLKDILPGNINPADVIVKNADGEHQKYQYTDNVLGLDKTITIDFDLGHTFADTYVGYIYFNIA